MWLFVHSYVCAQFGYYEVYFVFFVSLQWLAGSSEIFLSMDDFDGSTIRRFMMF